MFGTEIKRMPQSFSSTRVFLGLRTKRLFLITDMEMLRFYLKPRVNKP